MMWFFLIIIFLNSKQAVYQQANDNFQTRLKQRRYLFLITGGMGVKHQSL